MYWGVLSVFCAIALTSIPTHAGSISISTSSTVSLTESNGVATGTTSIGVTGNNIKNYQLYLSSPTNDTYMSGATSGNSDIISSIPSGITLSSFADNKWGVCVDTLTNCESSNFYSISRQDNPRTLRNVTLAASDNYAVNTTVNVTYAAKISNSLLADTYTGMQLISATAEDKAYFETITYMQEMSKTICDSEPTPTASQIWVPTKQLIDRRDDKTYWVAKLADGNCWMTQNLDLDLSTTTTLTPIDSDVSVNWTPDNSTTTNLRTGNTNAASVQSFDVGEYVMIRPYEPGNLCSSDANSVEDCSGIANMAKVDSSYTSNYTATGSGDSIVAINVENKTYDAHYLLGNYYTYNAATAGTGSTNKSGDATSSICPRGWRLPVASSSNNGSFGFLLNAYNLIGVSNNADTLKLAPFYFFRAGYINPIASGGIRAIRSYGLFISATSYNSFQTAYSLSTTGSDISLPFINSRYQGLSVRCVANFEETLDDITYMQEMTSEVCAATRTPSASETTTVPTKQLIDSRDGKSYWVAKLADGNCWMTQNLAYDLSTDVALTPDDSDVSANWTPIRSTQTTTSVTNNKSFSFNLGEYVIDSPNSRTNLCTAWAKSINLCTGAANIIDVSTGYTDDYIATGSDTSIVAVDTTNKKYDAHYLLGNYYAWDAATASSTVVNNNATDSICPKGWKLPVANVAATTSGSFANLFSVYGIGNDAAGATAAGASPLFLTRSGFMVGTIAGIQQVNSNGAYYSSTMTYATQTSNGTNASSGAIAYYTKLRNATVLVSDDNDPQGKTNAKSVRCLAR